MIPEKMALKFYPKDFTEEPNDPVVWYNLKQLTINDTITVKFSLDINTFKLILSLFDKDLSPFLWFYRKEDEYDYVSYFPDAKVIYIRFHNISWGEMDWFLPECTIQLKFDQNIEKDDIFNGQIDNRYRMFLKEKGKWSFSVVNSSDIVEFDDFDFNIVFDKNLFPIEMMCSKIFQDINKRDQIFEYFEENGENLRFIFNMERGKEFCSIMINGFNIDFCLKNRDIGNYIGVKNNLVIYGGGNEKSSITFSNEELSGFISLDEYEGVEPILMKDKFGNLAIEL